MKVKPLAIGGGIVGAVLVLVGACSSSPSSSAVALPKAEAEVLAVTSTADQSSNTGIVFPDCFGYPISVGTLIVYPGAPASCDTTTTTELSTSSTTTEPPSTSTTVTSTTSAPTTSEAPVTSTTEVPTTSQAPTTSAGPTTTQPTGSPACGLAAAAFCETFDQPHNGGTQTGDLDPMLWGVSRVADWNPGQVLNGFVVSHNPCNGGVGSPNPSGPTAPIPGDVRVCNGQMVESQNDGGAVTATDTYPKQPFSFTGRTGTVVFDVSDDTSGTHGAWPEFLITDEPVPAVHRCISECNLGRAGTPTAQNQIGFSMALSLPDAQGNQTGVDEFFGARGGVYFDLANNCSATITKGSSAAMNHIEVSVSTTQIDVWGTDAGGTALKLIGCAAINPGLSFSQGLVWLNDARYNARKAIEPGALGTQWDHAFVWDNLGFDGPKTYRDRGFDVPYANAPGGGNSQNGDPEYANEGYQLDTPKTFTLPGVVKGSATAAKVVLNVYTRNGTTITAQVNGHTIVSHPTPVGFHPDSFSIVVPLADVVDGTNTLKLTADDGSTAVANVTLILVAAAPVP